MIIYPAVLYPVKSHTTIRCIQSYHQRQQQSNALGRGCPYNSITNPGHQIKTLPSRWFYTADDFHHSKSPIPRIRLHINCLVESFRTSDMVTNQMPFISGPKGASLPYPVSLVPLARPLLMHPTVSQLPAVRRAYHSLRMRCVHHSSSWSVH